MNLKLISLLFVCLATAIAQPTFDATGAARTAPFRRVPADPGSCAPGDYYENSITGKLRKCVAVNTWGDVLTADATGAVALGGGGVLPGTCSVGQTFFLTTGTIGLYQCTAPNTWAIPGSGGGGVAGASALGSYIVQTGTNAPANAFNLGALLSGILKLSVSSGVATPATAGAGDLPTGYPYANLSGAPLIPAPSTTLPVVDSIASIGTAATFAKADHIHPSDLSKVSSGVDINSANQVTHTNLASPLPISQGGNGSATPGIQAGANVTVTGTWPNQIVNSAISGGTGGGASAANQLIDFLPTRISDSTITITYPSGGSMVGNNNVSFAPLTAAASIVLAPGSAAAGAKFWVYYDPVSAALKVDSGTSLNLAFVTFNNITPGSTGVSGYPTDVLPLYQLSAGDQTLSAWNTTPILYNLTPYRIAVYKPGAGLTRTCNPSTGVCTISVDPSQPQTIGAGGNVPIVLPFSTVPGSPGSACVFPTFAISATGFFVCTATNTWAKATLSSF